MNQVTYKINETSSYTLFLNDKNPLTPLIVVIPGGGYNHLSVREDLPVVNKFLSFNYNVCSFHYSVSNNDNFIQEKEIEYLISTLSKTYENIYLVGFSAGGHLTSLGITSNNIDTSSIKGVCLLYPVISFLSYVHEGTKTNFLGKNNILENEIKYSINNRILNKKTDLPPFFIFHSKEDKSVPYQNSLILKEALDKKNIKNKLTLFEQGPHGFALADETAILNGDSSYVVKENQIWIYDFINFINNNQ